MRFVKMHGLGNDYVYLDAVAEPAIERRTDLPQLARAMSDRHRGVGSDGLILVCAPTPSGKTAGAQVRMRMFNADGSESGMCGNGVRCVAKFAHDRLRVRTKSIRVETGRGVLAIGYKARGGVLASASVEMGVPILELERVPVVESRLAWHGAKHQHGVDVGGHRFLASFVSMGNPHMVVFNRPDSLTRELTVDDLERLDLAELGSLLETHEAFPERMNVHFVAVESAARARMRTWERGSGITMACGSGACAVAVAGVQTGRLGRKSKLQLPGGVLEVAIDGKTGGVTMAGPAEEVFEGEWPESSGRRIARSRR